MANSFDLLKNAEATKASSSKKKNKAKDNAQAANSNAQAANVPAPALKPSSSAPLDILEVQANNTRAARSAKTVGEFSKLWQDWTRQVLTHTRGPVPGCSARSWGLCARLQPVWVLPALQGSERGPKANKYKDASGSLVDFRQVSARPLTSALNSARIFVPASLRARSLSDHAALPSAYLQVLLTSQALEISLENAIVAGLTTQQQDTLTNLFQTYSSLDGHAAHYLAGAIVSGQAARATAVLKH